MVTSITKQGRALYDPGCPHEIPVPTTSLFEILNDTARLYPERIAIDFLGQTTTYEEFHRQTLKAASVLYQAGVRHGDVVAIALPNCPQALVVFYACMRLGAVAAEHNPLAPAPEVAGQLSRHRGSVAVVWEKAADSYPIGKGSPIKTLFTVDLTAGLPRSKRALLSLPVAKARALREQMRGVVPSYAQSWDDKVSIAAPLPDFIRHAVGSDRAAILHTGGTNGVPKSVPLTHTNIGSNINQSVFWVWKLNKGAETFMSILPYFHAFGLTTLLGCGVKLAATQVILPKFDADMVLEAMRRHPITFLPGVPPMFERILDAAEASNQSLDSIRWSICGAMPLSGALAKRWEDYTGGSIIEGYGLSETSPVSCGSPMSPDRRHGVLGLPFPSVDVRLVDMDDPTRDVEDGEPGEILLKGPNVFEGYLDAPEENAQVFTEDGWFRTGDIAVNEGGYIVLSDRKKELILTGGFNVYPSQVEDIIRMMPEVDDVAVVGMPVADAKEEVTAAIILKDAAASLSLEQVRAWAEKHLPHYALPKRLEFISELPRNQLGKVQRRLVREHLMPAYERVVTSMKEGLGTMRESLDTVKENLGTMKENLPTTLKDSLGSMREGISALGVAVREYAQHHDEAPAPTPADSAPQADGDAEKQAQKTSDSGEASPADKDTTEV